MSSAAYSQPVTQASASYAVGQQQQSAQYGPYGSRVQVCTCICVWQMVKCGDAGLQFRVSRIGV